MLRTNVAIALLKAQVKRRRDKGEVMTDDDIWNRINHNWPTATEQEREAVFQGVE